MAAGTENSASCDGFSALEFQGMMGGAPLLQCEVTQLAQNLEFSCCLLA